MHKTLYRYNSLRRGGRDPANKCVGRAFKVVLEAANDISRVSREGIGKDNSSTQLKKLGRETLLMTSPLIRLLIGGHSQPSKSLLEGIPKMDICRSEVFERDSISMAELG